MPKLPVLSLWRPWTTLILHHGKNVENRTWDTDYRGDLLIAGGLRFDTKLSWPVVAESSLTAGGAGRSGVSRDPAQHPTGIVGVVEVYGMCTASVDAGTCDCGPWAMAGHVHWQLRNPRAFLTPVPHRGFQKLHQVPNDNWPAVEKQLAEANDPELIEKCVACNSGDIGIERHESGRFLRCYTCGYNEEI